MLKLEIGAPAFDRLWASMEADCMPGVECLRTAHGPVELSGKPDRIAIALDVLQPGADLSEVQYSVGESPSHSAKLAARYLREKYSGCQLFMCDEMSRQVDRPLGWDGSLTISNIHGMNCYEMAIRNLGGADLLDFVSEAIGFEPVALVVERTMNDRKAAVINVRALLTLKYDGEVFVVGEFA